MHALVLYESLFGNTRRIAEAIGDGIQAADPSATVECVRIDRSAPEQLGAADLLVVGGPTHSLGVSTDRTRSTWLRRADTRRVPRQSEAGQILSMRGWLDALADAPPGRRAAAFDTRLDRLLAGGAAPRIAQRLRRCGYSMVATAEGFRVHGIEGPLLPGEEERARAWGARLVPQRVT